ncbi:MAG TPA: hypothetical protein VE870_07400, partial [Bacteroidales bacterium]|nr:hypothetical protein [Bacteroidales bacterium]
HTALERKLVVKLAVFIIGGFLVYVNFFQTLQYQRGLIHYLGMTREAYWNNFMSMHPKSSYWKKLSIPDMVLARKGIYYYYHTSDNFEILKNMTKEQARDSVRNEVLSRPQLMKEIRRYAKQNDITVDSSMNMVVDRVAEMKMEGKPF